MVDLSTIKSDTILDRSLFIRIGDLINIDAPFLTVFQDQKDAAFYLYDLMDSDGKVNRWIVYKVSPSAILMYLNQELTHLELFKQAENGSYYFTDIDPCNLLAYQIFNLNHLPAEYTTTEGNYFDEEYSADAEKILLFVNRAMAYEKANFSDWDRNVALPMIARYANPFGSLKTLTPNFSFTSLGKFTPRTAVGSFVQQGSYAVETGHVSIGKTEEKKLSVSFDFNKVERSELREVVLKAAK